MTLDPVPRSLVAVDIEGYSRRDNLGHLELREALRRVCDEAFGEIGVHGDTRQDQGDAFLILVEPDVAKSRLVADLVRELAQALRLFNRSRLPDARMRLRVALHSGDVHLDGTGYGGEAVIAVMRLIEADALREALKTAPDDLVVIVSERLHDEVVAQRYRGIDPADYREVRVSRKEFSQPAWIRVPGTPSAPAEPASHRGSEAEHSPTATGGAYFASTATFSGPTSIGGHAAGRDVHVAGRDMDVRGRERDD
jgi:class 3 adenylate cyclase